MIKHDLKCNKKRHDGQNEAIEKWAIDRRQCPPDWFTATAVFMASQAKKQSRRRGRMR